MGRVADAGHMTARRIGLPACCVFILAMATSYCTGAERVPLVDAPHTLARQEIAVGRAMWMYYSAVVDQALAWRDASSADMRRLTAAIEFC